MRGRKGRKGKRRGRREGEKERKPEVSLEVPSFDAFSILMAFTDGSIEL